MKAHFRTAIITASTAVAVVFLLAPLLGQGQSEEEKAKARAAARARGIALARENNSQILNLYDRQGTIVATVNQRDFYTQPVISPDKTRIAVVKNDPETETADAWVVDIATGKATRITTSQRRELTRAPVWSPDGKELAYVSLRAGSEALYRKAANGEGPEELLYKHSGFGMNLMAWSLDGRHLSYFTTDLSGGILFLLPLEGGADRKPIEAFRSTSTVQGARLSPDSRFLSYMSNQSGRAEMYVRPVDLSGKGAASGGPWQISKEGGLGMGFWRQDGKEFYYLAADRGFMAVTVNTTSPTFEFGDPRLLFRAPLGLNVAVGTVSVSRDGERFVIAAPAQPRLQQITVFDREGKILNKVGEPGNFGQVNLSPDGARIVTMRNDPKTNQNDIWTYEVSTGKGYPVTDDNEQQNAPIWSPDGKQVAYVSTTQKGMPSIYRKAWDGSGNADQVFTYTPGAGVVLTDWSPDGKFMAFWTQILVIVPLEGGQSAAERKGIEWLREEYNVLHGRFSPDMRHIAYITDQEENGKLQLYVRPFDAAKPEAPPAGTAVQVSADASGMIGWRADGKELYFLQPDPQNADVHVMAADVTATPAFQVGAPKLLFKLTGPVPGNSLQFKSVSSDGQRFAFAVNVPTPAR
jgi:Tol biopolymer transport system component